MAPSHLEQLREALSDYARQAESCAEEMEELQRRYKGYQERLLELIEGSASGKDREIHDAIEAAGSALRESQDTLRESGKSASDYGEEL